VLSDQIIGQKLFGTVPYKITQSQKGSYTSPRTPMWT